MTREKVFLPKQGHVKKASPDLNMAPTVDHGSLKGKLSVRWGYLGEVNVGKKLLYESSGRQAEVVVSQDLTHVAESKTSLDDSPSGW